MCEFKCCAQKRISLNLRQRRIDVDTPALISVLPGGDVFLVRFAGNNQQWKI